MFKTEYQSSNFKQWLGVKSRATQCLNPAGQALLIQILSLSLVLVSHYLAALSGLKLSLLMMFALQALFAIGFSYIFSMAAWWHVIHGLFPLLVGAMLKYPISQAYYFYGLVFTSALYWSTFRSQVPYFPSNSHVQALVKNIISNKGPVRVIDIGSGLGGLMMQLSKNMPHSSFYGIEIAPLPWVISFLRSKILKSSAKFCYGDYRNLSFADYDVIYAYLSPAVMSAVWQKAAKEMTSGSFLISNEFEIIDKPADLTLQAGPQSPKLYVWCM
ncbi:MULTISPECIES: class I SAM-dependent methyltransferase [Methylotenera]|uniref:class I SAM-dependent methyltransferase n=1 Tax=Methylotenera TaxID=359407 RepID=UPI0003657390|nr:MULTISPECIES: class I SAM-dependent methyltransferase [Methylotenera]